MKILLNQSTHIPTGMSINLSTVISYITHNCFGKLKDETDTYIYESCTQMQL